MKKIIILSSLLLSLEIHSQWIPQSTGATHDNYAIFFVDSSYGWIGGNGFVLKTTNGGNNWESSNVKGNVNTIYFQNRFIGFCATDWSFNNSFYGHYLYRTTNSGYTWEIVDSGDCNLFSILFIDDLNGYSVGTNYSQGIILSTTNGGLNWSQIIFNFGLRSITMLNDSIGFIAGGSPEKIWKTVDSGNNWTEIFTSPHQWGHFNKIVFSDSLNGFACGRSHSSSLYKTSNGGETWFNIEFPVFEYISVTAISNECWVILDSYSSDRILYSSDYGETWFPILHFTKPPYINDVFFVNNQIGWIIGSDGLLLHTINGGFDSIPNFSLPQIYYPINDTIITSTPVMFHWSENDFAFYRFQLSNDSLFNNIIYENVFLGNDEPIYNLQSNNNFFWRIRFENIKGVSTWSEIGNFKTGEIVNVNENPYLIYNFNLYQNYPNPFNSSTIIRFSIPISNNVILKVYDILGNDISTLVNEYKSAGDYSVKFNPQNLPSGIYIYRLYSSNYIQSKKLLLLK